MKKTNTILIILALVFWGLFFSLTARAQLNINMGVTDLKSQREGEHLVWGVGYTQYLESRFAIAANYRWTATEIQSFRAWEFLGRYAYRERNYRMELSAGINHNRKDWKVRPMVGMRNSFRLDEIVWLTLDFDHVFDKGTYLTFGVALDTNLFKELFRPFESSPRFF
ncbi:hypothetical protein [Flagellimonas flava]|uniref:hypothetical protein n=1 Tax=Flagellimonas flava TaxID=570519 RepID=UPI003D64C41E